MFLLIWVAIIVVCMGKNSFAVEVVGLKKSFGKVKVLKSVSFNVESGSIVALLGPNGAGKTTIVKILATLLEPDSGRAKVAGYDVSKNGDKVRESIGLTGQYAAIDEYLTGRENLRMMGRLYHLSKKDALARTEELLEEFDLVDAANRPAKTYSGGMRRRLDLAASLIASPPIIFLDEPTTGLDPRSRIAMWGIINNLAKSGSTILLTTQYLEEADVLANKILVLDDGKIIAEGTAEELKKKVGSERIELSFKDESSLDSASKKIKGKSVQIDRSKKTISLANQTGVSKLQSVLKILDESDIKVEGLSLHKPTMDDVFLELTGSKAKQRKTTNGVKNR